MRHGHKKNRPKIALGRLTENKLKNYLTTDKRVVVNPLAVCIITLYNPAAIVLVGIAITCEPEGISVLVV